MTTNPEVLRLARSDFGTANQAIEWVLHVNRSGQEHEFLSCWQVGDLSEWPEYLEWLDHLRQSEKDAGTQAAIADYDRTMREEVIPKIDADLKAQGRAAHFLRLGIPDPCQSEKDNSDAD